MIFDFPTLEESYSQTELFSGLDYPTGDDNAVIQKVIYEHYRTYKITLKNKTSWKLKYFYPRLLEIMPMFNKLYETADMIVQPLTNRNYEITKTFSETENTLGSKDSSTDTERADATSGYNNLDYSTSRDISDTENKTNTTTNTETDTTNVDVEETVTGSNSNTKKYSDTPQGRVANLTDGYLTNVTIDNGGNSETTDTSSDTSSSKSGSKSENGQTTSSSDIDETGENRENFLTANSSNGTSSLTEQTTKANTLTNSSSETIVGYDNTDVAKLLSDYRETIIDINTKLVNALADLFLQVYDYETMLDEIFGE